MKKTRISFHDCGGCNPDYKRISLVDTLVFKLEPCCSFVNDPEKADWVLILHRTAKTGSEKANVMVF